MSEHALLATISQAPIVFLFFYVFFQDKHGYEPLGLLIRSFVAGAISFVAAVLLELVLVGLNHTIMGYGQMSIAIDAMILVAFIEEGCKFVAMYLTVFRKPDFNEPYDGIMYSVSASLGFAAVENLGYCLEQGMTTAIFRIFSAVPMHAMAGVLMGYYIGLAKFNRPHRGRLLLASVVAAAIGHGLYDYFLLLGAPEFIPLSFAVLGVQIILGWRAIRHHRDIVLTLPQATEPLAAAAVETIDPAIAGDGGLLGSPLRWATISLKVLGAAAIVTSWLFVDAESGAIYHYLGIPVPVAVLAVAIVPIGLGLWSLSDWLKKLNQRAWRFSTAVFFLMLPTPFFPLALLGIYGVLHPETRLAFGHKPTSVPILAAAASSAKT